MTYGKVRSIFAGPVTLAQVQQEVVELLAEMRDLNLPGIREEWSDVILMCLLLLQEVGRPLRCVPVLPGLGRHSAQKHVARLKVWERIFDRHGVKFEVRYLIGGANYKRAHKVKAALTLAGVSAVDEVWLRENVLSPL